MTDRGQARLGVLHQDRPGDVEGDNLRSCLLALPSVSEWGLAALLRVSLPQAEAIDINRLGFSHSCLELSQCLDLASPIYPNFRDLNCGRW